MSVQIFDLATRTYAKLMANCAVLPYIFQVLLRGWQIAAPTAETAISVFDTNPDFAQIPPLFAALRFVEWGSRAQEWGSSLRIRPQIRTMNVRNPFPQRERKEPKP